MATSDPTVPPTRLDTQPHIFMQLYGEEDAKVLRPSKSVGAQSGGNVRTNPRPTPAHRLGGQQTAEVVLLYSSLAALHRASFASRRALHLLLCKQVDFYVIDANMDVGPGMSR
ncbi:hypothetical protein CSUI_002032 [Cystoisospora suis]|uniref:Uncharacterized protein n=1 Tax=Cystoisospora suis TaxID=483139 RepID=A0A2C6LAJ2_9APIC|nr:hypothetical protein CSUI_002032 [Cystoisospora suis]